MCDNVLCTIGTSMEMMKMTLAVKESRTETLVVPSVVNELTGNYSKVVFSVSHHTATSIKSEKFALVLSFELTYCQIILGLSLTLVVWSFYVITRVFFSTPMGLK